MFKKGNNFLRFLSGGFVLFLGAGFLFIGFNAVFAAGVKLNVDYPLPPNGPGITPQSSVPEYLKYIFDMGMFAGVIAVVVSLTIAGVFYFLSPVIPGALAKAKDRVFGSFSGLLILLLIYLIITAINPNLRFFRIEPLTPVTPPASKTQPMPGVYLYQKDNCSSPPDASIKTSSEYDLKNLNSKVQSAKIIQNSQGGAPYISLLFQSSNFWEKCFYISPNGACNSGITPPFASSISVYQYNFNPSAGDITFYREPFYNPKGGSFKVSPAETKGIYIRELRQLTFADPNSGCCTVPLEKQDCIKYDEKGACAKRDCKKSDETCYGKTSGCEEKKCPDLSGGNIGSIKINGDYVVLLIYFGPGDKSNGPWSLCQSFPTPDDKIRTGPNKINWENIENTSRLPNYVLIFPVIDNTNPDKK